jgi:hypothetical protein
MPSGPEFTGIFTKKIKKKEGMLIEGLLTDFIRV